MKRGSSFLPFLAARNALVQDEPAYIASRAMTYT